MKNPILIAEDDVHTSSLLMRYFSKEGFETLAAFNGEEALKIAQNRHPCFVILDLMMPGIDGWEVCGQLRTASDVPILILSARQEEADRILGLNLGADDYVVKPFSPREVVARVHAILRRSDKKLQIANEVLRSGELTLDRNGHIAKLSGKPLPLTGSEFIILRTLMNCAGRVFTRAEILDELNTEGQSVVDRVVDVHIASIRQKISAISDNKHYITTVRGVGYRMDK